AGLSTAGRNAPRVCLNRQTSVISALTEVLGDYPWCSLAWDGARLGPVVVDSRAEPIAHLQVGRYPVLGRTKGGRYEVSDPSDLRTRFSLRYDYDPVRQ